MDFKACSADFQALLQQTAGARDWWMSLPRRRLAKGETLARVGDRPGHAWHVEQGMLRLYFLAPDGGERNRSFQAEGRWVGTGMPLAANAGPSPFGIDAMEPSVVVCVPLDELRAQCATHAIAQALMHEIAACTFQRQSRREAELLLMDASQRYQSFLDEYGPIAHRIPLHQVASYIGITNVALSRLRRRRASTA